MVDPETQTASHPDLEPLRQFGRGDIVTLKESSIPGSMWLITTPIMDNAEGPSVSILQIDDDGNAIGGEGKTTVENIKEKLDVPKRTREEIEDMYVDAFIDKYGATLPREEIARMLREQQNTETTED